MQRTVTVRSQCCVQARHIAEGGQAAVLAAAVELLRIRRIGIEPVLADLRGLAVLEGHICRFSHDCAGLGIDSEVMFRQIREELATENEELELAEAV